MAFGLQIERTVGAKVYRDTGSRGSDCSDGGGTSLTAGSAANVERVSGIQQRPRVFIITHDVGTGTATAVNNRIDLAVAADAGINNNDAVWTYCRVGSDSRNIIRCPNVTQHIGRNGRDGAVGRIGALLTTTHDDKLIVLCLQKKFLV